MNNGKTKNRKTGKTGQFTGDAVKTDAEKPEKTTYQRVIDGDIEPTGQQKGWKNLIKGQREHNLAVIDPEKRKEICRKGAEAINQLHGEKKTAKQSLERILTLKVNDAIIDNADISPEIAEKLKRDNPDATIYDLIQLVAAGRALGGSIVAAQYIRDTHGDAPIKQIEVTENVTTDDDRALMRRIAQRLDDAESIAIVADITPNDVKTADIDAEKPHDDP